MTTTIELIDHDLPNDAPLDARVLVHNSNPSRQAAAYRVLKHQVMGRENARVIAVSGPTQGCAKTSVALNLALAFAEGGSQSVLLIDANIRHPEIASILRFVPPSCFLEDCLAHTKAPNAPWTVVDIKELSIHVAAVQDKPTTPRQLASAPFKRALDSIRSTEYDRIIIDCPPVLGYADVNLIQDAVDAVILATRGKQTTERELKEAVEQLSSEKIMGSVLVE